MADKLRITVGDVSVTATCRDTPTAQAVLEACPIQSQASTWGDEVYFSAPVSPAPESDQKQVVEPGEIAFWIDGGAIAVGFGPTPMSQGDECRLAAPCNIFADADDDVRAFKACGAGETVTVEKV